MLAKPGVILLSSSHSKAEKSRCLAATYFKRITIFFRKATLRTKACLATIEGQPAARPGRDVTMPSKTNFQADGHAFQKTLPKLSVMVAMTHNRMFQYSAASAAILFLRPRKKQRIWCRQFPILRAMRDLGSNCEPSMEPNSLPLPFCVCSQSKWMQRRRRGPTRPWQGRCEFANLDLKWALIKLHMVRDYFGKSLQREGVKQSTVTLGVEEICRPCHVTMFRSRGRELMRCLCLWR